MTDPSFQTLQQTYQSESKEFDKFLLGIPLVESNEDFLSISQLSDSENLNILFKDRATAYLRKTVATSLVAAVKHFNKLGFIVRVESAYRSIDEQKSRFIKRYNTMKGEFANKSHTELLEAANTYTAGIPILAAHTGGAAVDVTLTDNKGVLLDFGVPYPHGGIESITDYPNFSKLIVDNRNTLRTGMKKYGFTNYPFEYWHYSMGDVCAAAVNKQNSAVYGPIALDLSNPDNIKSVKSNIDLYNYFVI